MHLVYIDESQDQSANVSVFAALLVPADKWRECFGVIKEFRRSLKQSDGIALYKEFHAWKFVSGRGNLGSMVPKGRRCEIFNEALSVVANLPGVQLINACTPLSQEYLAFERLLNRIDVNVRKKGSHAFLICDEGKEERYTKMVRRMSVINHVPSKFGTWVGGGATKNIPIQNIIEDPVFKKSERSYFVQMADFCAFALLRNEYPTLKAEQYGFNESYDLLSPVFVPMAYANDPRKKGIIRGK